MKKCSKCQQVLAPENFCRNVHSADGLRCRCKHCEASARVTVRNSRSELEQAEYRSRTGTKKCYNCGVQKAFENFHKSSRSIDGHRGICIECRSQVTAESRERNLQARLEKEREYKRKNPSVALAASKKWREANKGLAKERRDRTREKNYALYQQRSWQKRGAGLPTRPKPTFCECCGRPPGKKGMALDHCHKTGKFRGWLCDRCNLGIGLLGDSVDDVLAALTYLFKASNE